MVKEVHPEDGAFEAEVGRGKGRFCDEEITPPRRYSRSTEEEGR